VSTPVGYFERMYAGSDDPWDFAGRWYEQRKRAITVASLPKRRYRTAFEPGCAIGLLTEQLAVRCDRVLAADAIGAAVRAARDRCAGHTNVAVEQRRLPDDWPPGRFDLIVLSELGYYFGDVELDRLLRHAVEALEPGGTLLAVHWRHPVAEHVRLGDDVQAVIRAMPDLDRLAGHEEADFRLEVFSRVPPAAQSVAQAERLW
jgi:SAM-dependent methyltransferase